MEQRNYMAEVQALIDQKWKENPEEMKRVMEEIKAKEKKEKEKPKVETPKGVSFDPQLTYRLILEMNQDSWDDVDMSKVQDLIKRGADVDAINKMGVTPLHLASYNNSIETAKLLIERGADVDAKGNGGWTPLYQATLYNFIEIAKLLLDRGADVKAKDNDGYTPLHRASRWNRIEIAKLLLDAGADVEAKDKVGSTPLDMAQSDEMEKLLKKYMK
jgi:ankyrin repeat protein